jgi:glycosyltransferase involved in cell wall biosynthesis
VRRHQLKIAVIAPPWFKFPPRGYGGVEAMCAPLVEGLVARGHDVTLVAASDGKTPARLIRTYDKPHLEHLSEAMTEMAHAAAVRCILAGLDVDVVHDHTLAGPLLADQNGTATVVTAYGPVSGETATYYRWLSGAIHLVAISDAQRANAPDLPWAGRVYNAVRVEDFPFREDKEDFVLFLGRANPEEGAPLAIAAAAAAGRRIIVAGKCSEPAERDYFHEAIEPALGPGATWIGEVSGQRKAELLAAARCLVFPVCWDDPSGLVMIEAMACGTQVVALRRGSVPEVVTPGKTGFICENPGELPAAIQEADRLSPLACRNAVCTRFHMDAMAAGYERVYQLATSR